MTDERREELGLTRRPFLKKMIAGTFAAPVILSFGIGGIAEASADSGPLQCFPNQGGGFFLIEAALGIIANNTPGAISPGVATSLTQKLTNALSALGSPQIVVGQKGGNIPPACGLISAALAQISAQAGVHISSDVATELTSRLGQAQDALDCACFAALS